MEHVTKVVQVNSKPESVIEYLSDVNNHPAFIEPLKDISDIKGDPKQAGCKWNWEFMMAGIEFKGESETVEYDPKRIFSYKTNTGIISLFKYTVEPEGEGSRLTIDVEYNVPESALAKIADKTVIARNNEDAADKAADNIKSILEG